MLLYSLFSGSTFDPNSSLLSLFTKLMNFLNQKSTEFGDIVFFSGVWRCSISLGVPLAFHVERSRGNWEDQRCDFPLLCRGVVGAVSESSAKDCTFPTLETSNTSVNYAGSLLVAVLWLNYKFYIQSLHSYILIHCVGERALMKLITWTHWHHLSWPSIAKS